MYTHYPEKRYRLTLEFLKKHVGKEEKILDLGVPNPFSEIMSEEGYEVENTGGEDLDLSLDAVRESDASVVTAFEILEHLVARCRDADHLKSGGMLVVEHSPHRDLSQVVGFHELRRYGSTHFSFFRGKG